jgi:hypothetical protein
MDFSMAGTAKGASFEKWRLKQIPLMPWKRGPYPSEDDASRCLAETIRSRKPKKANIAP